MGYVRRQLLTAALTANAIRPFPGLHSRIPAFFAGWLTGELAPQVLGLTAADTAAARWRAVAAVRGEAVALQTPEQSITFADAASRVDDLARTIVALGETLSLRTIAEGVEEPVQQERLRAMGCQLGQGYLFARPLDGAAMLSLLCGARPVGAGDGA